MATRVESSGVHTVDALAESSRDESGEKRGPLHRRRAQRPRSTADWVPRQRMTRDPDDGWQLAAPVRLSKRKEQVFRGLMRVFLPPPPAPQLTPELEEAIVDQSLRLLAYMHPMTQWGMRLAMTVVDWSPRWRFKSWRRLHRLQRERADALIDRLGHSRIPIVRTLVFVVRGLILSVYFDQTAVHRALDYDPEGFIDHRIEMRRRLLAGEALDPSDAIGPFSEAGA